MKDTKKIIAVICSFAIANLILSNTAIADKPQTKAAQKQSNIWQNANNDPITDPNGRVMYQFGVSQPQVICAPLALCDIGLEPGEVINSVNIGDSARWVVTPARVGTGDTTEEHIIVKPIQAGLRTSLFVGTDRRAYLIELISTEKQYMSKVGFIYNDSPSTISALASNSGQVQLLPPRPKDVVVSGPIVETISGHDVIASNLDFKYRVFGSNVPWKPIRVYDDGVKTFIDLDPKKVSSRELPTLLINDTNHRGSMINYRYIDGRFIVDGLFSNASLVIGKGSRQKKVKIKKINSENYQQKTVKEG